MRRCTRRVGARSQTALSHLEQVGIDRCQNRRPPQRKRDATPEPLTPALPAFVGPSQAQAVTVFDHSRAHPLLHSLSCFCNSTGTALPHFVGGLATGKRSPMPTDDECLRYAREYARLAGLTNNRNVRDQLRDLARGWTAIAQYERRSDARVLYFTPVTTSPETQQRSRRQSRP